jgi:hypothetical protein
MRNAEEDKSCETIIKRSERGQQGKKFPYLHDTGLVGGNYPLLPLEILGSMVAALLHPRELELLHHSYTQGKVH